MATPEGLLKDIVKGLSECQEKDYYGKFVVTVNVQGGNIKNVSFAHEKGKRYEV